MLIALCLYEKKKQNHRCSTPCIAIEDTLTGAKSPYDIQNTYASSLPQPDTNLYGNPYTYPYPNYYLNSYPHAYAKPAYVHPVRQNYQRRQPKYKNGYQMQKIVPVNVQTKDFTQCSSLTILLNRFIAETNRKNAFASIYEGPISNVGKTRRDS